VGRDWRRVLALTDPTGRDWWACTRPYDGLSTRTRQPERRLVHRLPDAELDLLVTARYVRNDQRRVVRLVVAFRDTEARARHERSRADLVSTVAHELRSPLTSIKGFTATLLSKWDRFTDQQKRLMLETVNFDADRVTRLLSELLDVSRIDAHRLELRPQVVDVPAAVSRAVQGQMHGGVGEPRFVVRQTAPLPEMWLDPDKFDQILGNLLENAVRHGQGTVTITIEPTVTPEGASLTVVDEGRGIPEEVLSRVFTRFWRADHRRGGTGLGLYIVKGLVGAHGGTVEAGNSPEGGARFRLVLPVGTPAFM
jgi:hypothetical protein